MSQLPIDIDAEAIYFDGHWYTRDDLARRIKAMLDRGDFAVTRPSAALEQLTAVRRSVRTLAFRATPDMIEAINAGAARAGKSVGAFIREALSQEPGACRARISGPRASGDEAAAGCAAAGDAERPQLIRNRSARRRSPRRRQAPIAGPGALRAAQNERLPSVVVEPALAGEQSPVELTHKKTKEDEATERRWFNS